MKLMQAGVRKRNILLFGKRLGISHVQGMNTVQWPPVPQDIHCRSAAEGAVCLE